MHFGRDTALRAVAGMIALAFVSAAVGMLTLGLYQWLWLAWGPPGAAFGTAGVCLVLASGVAVFAFRHASAPVMQSAHAPAIGQSSHLVLALRDLAMDHPFAAVCAAAVLGAVGGGDEFKRR